jgi:signal peptidase I
MSALPLPPEVPSTGLPRSAARRHPTFAARAALATLWFAVLPALLAALALRYLVPAVVTGGGAVAKDAILLAQEHLLPLGLGLFFLFAALARYWRFALPGGPYLSPLAAPLAMKLPPAQRRTLAEAAALEGVLSTARMRRRLERALDGEHLGRLDLRLAELRAGLEAGDEALVRNSASATRAAAAPVLTRSSRSEFALLVATIAAIAAATLCIRSRLVESYSVLSGSMLPTLQPEDRLLGNRLAYRRWSGAPSAQSPRRGDIVVFRSSAVDGGNLTDSPEYLVKRVIGLPGDRISMRGGVPVINGWTVPVCDAAEYLYVLHGGENGLSGRVLVEFLDDRAYLTVHAVGSAAFAETYDVKPGEVFVLGDNRNNSSDSRAWNDRHGGGVPVDAIEARVRWFVAGRRADLSWDFGRLLRPVDSLATTMHLDGVNVARLQAGIDLCLQKRPEKTQPPPLGETEPGANATSGAAVSP